MSDRLALTVAQALKISPEQVGEDLSPATCGEWDSLGHFEIILAVEEAFGVRFSVSPDDEPDQRGANQPGAGRDGSR